MARGEAEVWGEIPQCRANIIQGEYYGSNVWFIIYHGLYFQYNTKIYRNICFRNIYNNEKSILGEYYGF